MHRAVCSAMMEIVLLLSFRIYMHYMQIPISYSNLPLSNRFIEQKEREVRYTDRMNVSNLQMKGQLKEHA